MSRRRTEVVARISASDLQQRVLRLPNAAFLPPPDTLFDVWHQGVPWAARLRSEPCCCPHPPRHHRHLYIEGGELHAGLRWRLGAELRFRWRDGRILVDGDLDP